ncbi:MAG: tRNA (guanine(26)-N(2))-dimethyltransferase [Thermoplasmata archaeon]|nr:tRNA (guanine(26)-N(2))-dimethyltransferase [Thermoplasmata archaeon]
MSPEGSVIREGGTDILVPQRHSTHGPGKKMGTVFFNEQMSFNRDVSVMLLRALNREKLTVADAMAATGSRSVRIANEVPNTEVVANDISSDAMPWIRRNIEINSLSNCEASNRDMHVLFSERTFGYVDLDPFGSPVPFLQSAIRGCGRRAVLAVTATDMAPLAGAHAVKCRRRYQCEPVRGYMCHEGGLRILMCTVARELAKFDRGMRPLLSFYADHYYRTYVQIEEGAKAADATLARLGYMEYDTETMERSLSPVRDDRHPLGPFWLGPLHDQGFVRTFSTEGMADERRCRKYIDLWTNELDDQVFVYDVSELSSHLKMSPPRIADFVEMLNQHGRASLTHFSPTEFMTDIPLSDLIPLYRDCSPDSQ